MKITMKVMLMTLAMVLTTVLVNAQPQGARGERGGDPTERAKKQTEHLTTKLELTDKQAAKIEKINLEYASKMTTMRDELKEKREAGEEIDRENVREQMKTMREAQAEEIKGVLTPAQIEKFDVIMEERKEKNEGRSRKGKKGKKGKAAKEQEEGVEESDN